MTAFLRLAMVVAVAFVTNGAELIGQTQPASIAAWRASHERQIVDELLQLVSLPNVAAVDDLAANAKLLETLFTRRAFKVEQFAGSGSPVVFASLDVPAPRGSITLYIHYDGQPVNAAEWTRCKPFAPCLYSATGPVALEASIKTFDPQWRVYGRSAADDKAPIIATLNAVDALRAIGIAAARASR